MKEVEITANIGMNQKERIMLIHFKNLERKVKYFEDHESEESISYLILHWPQN